MATPTPYIIQASSFDWYKLKLSISPDAELQESVLELENRYCDKVCINTK